MTRKLSIPPVISYAMRLGAALVVSISGGKDSQAMLMALVIEYKRNSWKGPIYALHMDLGRAEWPETLPHCQRMAAQAGIELIVIRRPQGDLIKEIQDRMQKLRGTDKPYWPSSGNRYCTSDQKTSQADKILRRFELVVSAIGIRAEESTEREKKNPLTIRDISSTKFDNLTPEQALNKWVEWKELGAKRQPTLCFDWFPIFDWLIEDVYHRCGHTIEERNTRRALFLEGEQRGNQAKMDLALADWWMHPGYVYGNDRISCVFCVLGSLRVLRPGEPE